MNPSLFTWLGQGGLGLGSRWDGTGATSAGAVPKPWPWSWGDLAGRAGASRLGPGALQDELIQQLQLCEP